MFVRCRVNLTRSKAITTTTNISDINATYAIFKEGDEAPQVPAANMPLTRSENNYTVYTGSISNVDTFINKTGDDEESAAYYASFTATQNRTTTTTFVAYDSEWTCIAGVAVPVVSSGLVCWQLVGRV